MSLQFILGGSGTGKSACLYEMVINRSMAEPDADIILLVPEQYTMLTQRHLVRQHPRHSVLNVDVLSFERLAYRIFEETGTDCREILDDTGKSMILRRILAGHGGELHAFGGNVRKRGFTDQVKSMLSELLQYGVDPALLQEKGAALAPESRLFAKIRDISLIYTHFLDFIGDRYMTTEQVLDRLCTVIGKSDRMKKAVIYMDNFTGFTPVQLKVMEKILQICPEVAMTLCAGFSISQKRPSGEWMKSAVSTGFPGKKIFCSERMDRQDLLTGRICLHWSAISSGTGSLLIRSRLRRSL